jgi:hypothetical protein
MKQSTPEEAKEAEKVIIAVKEKPGLKMEFMSNNNFFPI